MIICCYYTVSTHGVVTETTAGHRVLLNTNLKITQDILDISIVFILLIKPCYSVLSIGDFHYLRYREEGSQTARKTYSGASTAKNHRLCF